MRHYTYGEPQKITDLGAEAIIHLNDRASVRVDSEDLPRLAEYRWHVMRMPKHTYAAAYVRGSAVRAGGKKVSEGRVYIHRIVMNAPAGMVVDHINGFGLDCRKSNLRIVTPSQNAANRTSDREITRLRGILEKHGIAY